MVSTHQGRPRAENLEKGFETPLYVLRSGFMLSQQVFMVVDDISLCTSASLRYGVVASRRL